MPKLMKFAVVWVAYEVLRTLIPGLATGILFMGGILTHGAPVGSQASIIMLVNSLGTILAFLAVAGMAIAYESKRGEPPL